MRRGRISALARSQSACPCGGVTRQSDTPLRMKSVSLSITDSLRAIPATEWDALVGDAPLLSHAFLHALHDTGCAAPETGWTPRYVVASCAGLVVGSLPLYLKAHSYS